GLPAGPPGGAGTPPGGRESPSSGLGVRRPRGSARAVAVIGDDVLPLSGVGAGDFIYIEPGVPHEVFNLSDTGPFVAVVARLVADHLLEAGPVLVADAALQDGKHKLCHAE